MLHVVNNRQIVQTWRSSGWKKTDGDSVLALTFTSRADGGTDLQMVHSSVPDDDLDGVKKGWNGFYWDKWKEALAPKAKTAPKGKAKPPAKKIAKSSSKSTAKSSGKSATKSKTAPSKSTTAKAIPAKAVAVKKRAAKSSAKPAVRQAVKQATKRN